MVVGSLPSVITYLMSLPMGQSDLLCVLRVCGPHAVPISLPGYRANRNDVNGSRNHHVTCTRGHYEHEPVKSQRLLEFQTSR